MSVTFVLLCQYLAKKSGGYVAYILGGFASQQTNPGGAAERDGAVVTLVKNALICEVFFDVWHVIQRVLSRKRH
jgi:hypothetical protein